MGLKSFFYSRKIILDSLHHAMYFASCVLYSSFMKHLKVPKGIWYDLHSLYQVSNRLGLSNKKLITTFANQQLNTINSIYKNFILLAIVDPTRFKKKSITQFLYLTEQWVSLLTLTEQYNKAKTLYYIDPTKDTEPKFIAKDNVADAKVLFIDLSNINKRLENLSKYHKGDEPEERTF